MVQEIRFSLSTPTIEEIDAIATAAHEGQFRKFGGNGGDPVPYIVHPRRVAAKFTDYHRQATGLLHDVLEDTELTAADLLAAKVPQPVIVSVLIVTRGEETYGQFLDRIILSGDQPAIDVKIEDIQDNLSDLPLGNKLRARYEAGLRRMGHVA